jgi:hypothetical protein
LEAADDKYLRKAHLRDQFEPITELKLAQNKHFLSLFLIFSYLRTIASFVPKYFNNLLLLYLIERDIVTKNLVIKLVVFMGNLVSSHIKLLQKG